MTSSEWQVLYTHVRQLEQQGLVTRTFRRLDPERQEAVLVAILEEAVEKGPTALNIKQVASRAGVAIGSLYQYFGNRANLLDVAVELCARTMIATFEQYRPYLASLPLHEGLTAYLVGGIEWSRTQVSLVRFFARAAYYGEPALEERVVRPVATLMRQMVYDMLAAGQTRGEVRQDLDLDGTTRLIHALLIAVGDAQLLPYLNTYFQVVDEDRSPEQRLDVLLDFVFNGIAPG